MTKTPKYVTVRAPARLHMGFLDLNGSLGRQFGSIGIGLNELYTQLTLSPAAKSNIIGFSSERAERCLHHFCQQLGISSAVKLEIHHAIPEHVGLGSGTQMALAIGAALNVFYDLKLSVRELAAIMERGLRSGIGIGVFEAGGLVVDGGRGAQTLVPPLLSRIAVPESWRIILVLDQRGQGLHGSEEINAFSVLPVFPLHEVEHFSYLLLMRALPALAEGNLEDFGSVITALQQRVGEHFAPAQGGIFFSDEVAKAIGYFGEHGAYALGQTSWGPTGFCLVENENIAKELVSSAADEFNELDHLDFAIYSIANQGARITV